MAFRYFEREGFKERFLINCMMTMNKLTYTIIKAMLIIATINWVLSTSCEFCTCLKLIKSLIFFNSFKYVLLLSLSSGCRNWAIDRSFTCWSHQWCKWQIQDSNQVALAPESWFLNTEFSTSLREKSTASHTVSIPSARSFTNNLRKFWWNNV